ncbi:MAG: T9SS type A sorting domain-containing protein, partial [Bacteroidetes bacterium]|nr:T9SS type A sorting domain-containing protein [Bacteroidota bacterium]
SQWISPYNTQSLNMNNHPPADPYRLEFCFCICDGVDSIRIDMRILADNMATVLLDGTPLFAFSNPNAVSNFQQPGHFVEVVPVQPGTHCLQIDLRNWSGVAMGVNAAGVITNADPGGGAILLDPSCCDSTGTIIGQKIYDRNCNGIEDNRPNNQTLEPPLPGWTITLNPGGFTAVTDANGFFYFNDVPPGTYTLTETPQSGWVPTSPASGSQTVTVGVNQVVYANFLNCKNPPDPCDEFSEGRLDTTCCTYHFDISNVVGDITQISYNVTGGTVNGMSFDPCAYTTTPASLAGSSSGVINFGTPCNDNMQVSVDVTPTTASGEICIKWVVVHADGSRCVYETCWTCERPPLERCDDIKAQPFHQQNVSIDYRTFTIINQKLPASPICSIDISMEDSGGNSPTSGWQGGDLYIDGALIPTGTRFVFPYDRIPNAGASDISSYNADTVRFNLGIDYTVSWTGIVTFVIAHCDGDTCVVRYGPWTAAKPGGSGPVVVVAEKAERRLFGQGLRIRNTSGGPIRWVSVAVENGQDEVYAVSAAQWLGAEQYPGAELLAQSAQGRRKALFTFAEDLASGAVSDLIHLVIARDSSQTQPPVIRWTTYGDDGNAISSDTISIGGTVTTIRGPSTTLSPEDFSLLESFPNPARTQLTVNFAMGKAANIRLELYDGSGRLVSTIRDGYETQGLRSVPLSTAGLSPGRYFLRLSSGDRADTQSFVIVK